MQTQLTEQEALEYERKIDELIDLIVHEPETAKLRFHIPSVLTGELVPEHPANARLLAMVKKLKPFLFSYTDLSAAMKSWTREMKQAERDLQKPSHQTSLALATWYDREPADERDYVAMFMAGNGLSMSFDKIFTDRDGCRHSPIDISNGLHLTAASLGLVPPRNKEFLSVRHIGLALDEWCSHRRQEARQKAAERVARLPEGVDSATVEEALARFCSACFYEPAFGAAAMKKIVWSVKRKLRGLPIDQPHMIVFVGQPNTMKTWMCRRLMRPINELAAEVPLTEIIDNRQIDLIEHFLLFPDEMSYAGKVEMAALKSFITGAESSRRPMASNLSAKVQINATLLGTSNHSLGNLLFDSTGMRRFAEVNVRTRNEIHPVWDADVEPFDWLQFWQSVDANGPDPLVSEFEDVLRTKQEEMRNKDNVEMWLRGFEFDRNRHEYRRETSSHERVEFYGIDLYTEFKQWEAEYDRAYRGTSLQRWGRDMKILIDGEMKDTWSYRSVANRKVYAMKLPAVKAEPNAVVPFRSIPTRKGK